MAFWNHNRQKNASRQQHKELDAMRLEGIGKARRYARVMRGKLH